MFYFDNIICVRRGFDLDLKRSREICATDTKITLTFVHSSENSMIDKSKR